MKSTFKITIVLAMMVIASASYATGYNTFIKAKGEKLFSVHHNTKGEFRFTIKDQSGNVVYSVSGDKNKKFLKAFDVKNLPNGRYVLEAKDANVISTFDLHITSEGMNISKNQALTSAR